MHETRQRGAKLRSSELTPSSRVFASLAIVDCAAVVVVVVLAWARARLKSGLGSWPATTLADDWPLAKRTRWIK